MRTYYIVSEGYSANGVIVTAVSGELPPSGVTYTYDASGNRMSRKATAAVFSAAPEFRSFAVKDLIDLSAYAPGLYMAVISVDGESVTHKIVRK